MVREIGREIGLNRARFNEGLKLAAYTGHPSIARSA